MRIKLNGAWIAGLLVLLANAFVLVHVARNRTATPVAEYELTDRELRLQWYGEDNSGVGLNLIFNSDGERSVWVWESPSHKVYLALEYDGAAFPLWQERRFPNSKGAYDEGASRLVLIDVGRDAATLRRKYPDAKKVIILPGASRGTGPNAWARLEVGLIHVPLPHSNALKGAPHYRVVLRQGPSLELWVAEVKRL